MKFMKCVCLMFLPAAAAMAQTPAILGIWELDLQASRLPKTFQLASETRSYDLRDDGYLVNVVIRKTGNGHPDFIQVVSRSDGKDYPQYQSAPLADLQTGGAMTRFTYSETVLDERSVSVIGKYDGRVTNKGVRRVSPDGKTMRIEVVSIDQSGQETPITLVFNRVGRQ